ncbi:MAG: murein biosynthesis integral membrane protein MurJ [Deltaproteobacteria bacterium]|nr:murein biosynthesis integral membrane protein MurJ [Deltaproteobacteria bacterium]MBN2671237.1 murein biosynthesis integral membrane protein MurJ [Deltaproteobacteria bacterium]
MNDSGKTVTRRAGIVGAGTMSSRVLGLVRESVIAAYFPKEAIDAYQVAFMLPNSFRRLTAEGSFSISLTTVFTKLWQQDDLRQSREFVASVYGFGLLFLTVLTVAGVAGAYWLTLGAGNGFVDNPEKFALAVSLTRTMFPYIFFISLTAIAMGLLNSAGKFFAPAFAPVLLNVSIIGCAVGISGTMPSIGVHPIFSLAVGVLIGGIAQMIAQLPSLKQLKLLVFPQVSLMNPHLRRVLRLTGPMVFGAAAYQLWNIEATALASTLKEGSVTYITFAQRLFELPLAVLVMAISTAALPSLAGLVGKNKIEEAKQVWSHAFRLALLVSTPAMVAIIILAEPLVTIMYQRGLFSHHDVLETAGALRWLAAGMCSVALLRQTVPFFYALEKVKIPVVMLVVMIAVYTVAAFLLKDIYGHQGLCMSLSLAATVQGIGLFVILRVLIGRMGIKRLLTSWLRILAATVPMGGAVYGVSRFGDWAAGGNNFFNIGVLGLCVVAGVLVYAASAYVFRVSEFLELFRAVLRRVRK